MVCRMMGRCLGRIVSPWIVSEFSAGHWPAPRTFPPVVILKYVTTSGATRTIFVPSSLWNLWMRCWQIGSMFLSFDAGGIGGRRRAVIKIFLIFPVERGFQLSMGRRNETEIAAGHPNTAQCFHFLFFQDPEGAWLHLQRQIADFIEEDGPAVSQAQICPGFPLGLPLR